MLCHGDYTPKNLLAHGAGFTLVDYETAHFGDPTMDLGLFLTHLMLKAVRRPEQRSPFFDLTRAFWRGYGAEVRFRPLAELEERGIAHLGVCLLARIDGTSPVDYLPGRGKTRGGAAAGAAHSPRTAAAVGSGAFVRSRGVAKLMRARTTRPGRSGDRPGSRPATSSPPDVTS